VDEAEDLPRLLSVLEDDPSLAPRTYARLASPPSPLSIRDGEGELLELEDEHAH
jgi:hypothetical protein